MTKKLNIGNLKNLEGSIYLDWTIYEVIIKENEYLIRLMPTENGRNAHHALVIFGRNMIEDNLPGGGGWKIPTNMLYKDLDNNYNNREDF